MTDQLICTDTLAPARDERRTRDRPRRRISTADLSLLSEALDVTRLDRAQPPPDALFEIMRPVRSLVGADSACFLDQDCLDFTVPHLQYLDNNDAVAFSPDGRHLKVARLSGAQLWDAERLEPIGAPFPDGPDQRAATLAADTNQLATVADRATLVWNIDLDTWPELACLAAGRKLTREEWEEFGPGGDYRATCDRWPAG
jgi:hypothetical protein